MESLSSALEKIRGKRIQDSTWSALDTVYGILADFRTKFEGTMSGKDGLKVVGNGDDIYYEFTPRECESKCCVASPCVCASKPLPATIAYDPNWAEHTSFVLDIISKVSGMNVLLKGDKIELRSKRPSTHSFFVNRVDQPGDSTKSAILIVEKKDNVLVSTSTNYPWNKSDGQHNGTPPISSAP